MPLSYREISHPAIEPVTLLQAKAHLRVDFPDDDALITGLITAARQHVEKLMNRSIFNRRMRLTLDAFPWPGWDFTTGTTARQYFLDWYYRGLVIKIPKPTTVSIESLRYIDPSGTWQTIAPAKYNVDLNSEPARIAPAPGYTWPYQQNFIPGSVAVEFTSGTYELPVTEEVDVPAAAPYTVTLKQASKLISLVSLVASDGTAIPFTSVPGGFSVAAEYAGVGLTATYTVNCCPFTVVAAILLVIGHLYTNREASTAESLKVLPIGVEELLAGEVFDSFFEAF